MQMHYGGEDRKLLVRIDRNQKIPYVCVHEVPAVAIINVVQKCSLVKMAQFWNVTSILRRKTNHVFNAIQHRRICRKQLSSCRFQFCPVSARDKNITAFNPQDFRKPPPIPIDPHQRTLVEMHGQLFTESCNHTAVKNLL